MRGIHLSLKKKSNSLDIDPAFNLEELISRPTSRPRPDPLSSYVRASFPSTRTTIGELINGA